MRGSNQCVYTGGDSQDLCRKGIISAPNGHAEPLIGPNGMIGIGIAVDMECQHPALTITWDWLNSSSKTSPLGQPKNAARPSKMYTLPLTEQGSEAKASAMVFAFCSSHRRDAVSLRVPSCSRRNASWSDDRFRSAAHCDAIARANFGACVSHGHGRARTQGGSIVASPRSGYGESCWGLPRGAHGPRWCVLIF